MKRKAVGFYWTLPVPWDGFTKLPDDIEGAAKASRTIRYQRALVHAYAASQGYELIREVHFLEIEPDRGTDFILEPLRKVEALCQANSATMLYVEFAEVQGWRSHAPLDTWAHQARIDVTPISAGPAMVDGKLFDPHRHFADWRERQRQWTDAKPQRIALAAARAEELKAEGLGNAAAANALNDERVLSPTGKMWTADSLRKFIRNI